MRRILLLLIVVMTLQGFGQESYPYVSPTEKYRVNFRSTPRQLRVDGAQTNRIGDDSGLSVAVYRVPGGSENKFFEGLIAQPTDSSGAVLDQTWIEVDKRRALKRTSYPNSRILPTADPSNTLRLYEQILIVEDGKVYDLVAFINGKDKKTLEEEARSFWSSFKLHE